MSTTQGFRMKNQAHPAGFVNSEIVKAMSLSVNGAASALGITRPAPSALLNEPASLSSEMALRIMSVLGVSMDPLLCRQTSHDIARTHEREDGIDLVPFGKRVACACVVA